jgi:hypothetical protein
MKVELTYNKYGLLDHTNKPYQMDELNLINIDNGDDDERYDMDGITFMDENDQHPCMSEFQPHLYG